jgi:hypothetical protein
MHGDVEEGGVNVTWILWKQVIGLMELPQDWIIVTRN